MDPALQDLLAEGAPDDEVRVILRLADPDRPPAAARIISRFGDVATARVRREAISEVWADDATISEKAPHLYQPDLQDPARDGEPVDGDEAAPLPGDHRLRLPPGVTGAGVVIGVVDWGIDVAHPALRRATTGLPGPTVVLSLWDQRSGAGAAPAPYGYGRVMTRPQIDSALQQEDPYAALDYHPADFDAGFGAHGTHTASIAMGSGGGGGPVGVAPDADLVFVSLGRAERPAAPLGDSVELLEALDFIVRTAAGRPCVINLSLGRHAGEHTGRSLVEMAMDQLLEAVPGLAIVQSCGNYYTRRVHTFTQLRPGDRRSFRLTVDPADRTANEIDIWYSGRDRIRVAVASQQAGLRRDVGLGENATMELDGRPLVRIRHRYRDPNNGDNQCRVVIAPTPAYPDWDVTVLAEDVVDGRVHAWIERDSGCRTCQSRFASADADPQGTTGSIANGFLTVAVGAVDLHRPDCPPARFSSSGPTRDGRDKPDLGAPGVGVLGARSTPRGGRPGYTRMSGTSMAAPHVTGTVALMFQAAGRLLSIAETRAALLAGCERPPPDTDPHRLGSGYLDPARTVELLRVALRVPTQETPKNAGTTEEAAEQMNAERIDVQETDLEDTAAETTGADGTAAERASAETTDVQETDVDLSGSDVDAAAAALDPWPDDGDAVVADDDDVGEDPHDHDCGTLAEALGAAGLLSRLVHDDAPWSSPTWHRQVFGACGLTDGSGEVPGAAEVFDTWTAQLPTVAQQRLRSCFDVVGAPRQAMRRQPRAGDLVIVRARGGPFATLTLVMDPQLRPVAADLRGRGPAGYAVGAGAGLSGSAGPVQVADDEGAVPPNVLLLRPQSWQGYPEAVPGRCPDVQVLPHQRPRVLVRGSAHPAVREVQRKLNSLHAHRVATGQPGLPEAPLVDDCVLGRRTATALRAFQELVFPGQPREHDAKVGERTWAQLDAIAAPAPSAAAQVTVHDLRLCSNGFAGPLSWDQVVGVDVATVNVEVTASGLPVAVMPAHVVAQAISRVPNRAGGATTLPTAVGWEVPLVGPSAAHPDRALYRLRKPLTDAGPFEAVERRFPEVATVARPTGTSDEAFRTALGWTSRGSSDQPTTVSGTSGSPPREIPDARALLRAGGVEVLDIALAPRPNWRAAPSITRLVRSPADVVYYSGHGLSSSGQLAIDTESKPCPGRGTYRDWMSAADLRATWASPSDLDVLILAGCSVLAVNISASPPTGNGLAWAELLTTKGGPLAAVLGYRAGAPCDHPLGDRIATAMGSRLAAGSRAFARDWLEVNGDANATNAVALDAGGYWWIDQTWGGLSYEVKGPRALP